MTSPPVKTIYLRSPAGTTLRRLAASVFFMAIGLFFCAISGVLVPRILADLGIVSPPPGTSTMPLWRLVLGAGACGGLGLMLLVVPARWALDLASAPRTLEGPLERKHHSTYVSPQGSRRATWKLFVAGESFEVNEATFASVHEGMALRAELDRWSRALRRLDQLA